MSIAQDISRIDDTDVMYDVPMSGFTSFRVGGAADALVFPRTERAVLECVRAGREHGLLVIGRGTNLLVRDGGYRGMIVVLGDNFSQLTASGRLITAQAGASLSRLVAEGYRHGLVGAEPLAGIPGSVGGAVIMNAEAFGGQTADIVRSVRVMTAAGELCEREASELEFGYRYSSVAAAGDIVISAVFELEQGDVAAARTRMQEIAARRREKQPTNLPSAGSVFKRPAGYYAGALIEAAGMKGKSVGAAQVSPKHAGFIVNNGGASSAQIEELINTVKREVMASSGVALECEVRIIGERA